jgi:putative hydrolase of the HAD superfamily
MTSAQLGVAKPDDQVWAIALEHLGAPAIEVSFFDDRDDNVAAASSFGIDAHHWTGLHTLEALLGS